jgi:hypothetical protein
VTVMVETVVLALVSARLPVLSFAQPMYPQPGRSVGDGVELLLDEVVADMTLVLSVLDTDVCLDDEGELELEETDPGSAVLLVVIVRAVLLLERGSVLVLDTEVSLDDEDELGLEETDPGSEVLLLVVIGRVVLLVDRIVLELPRTLDDDCSVLELPRTPDDEGSVLELPRTLDDEGSTTSLAPQTPELLFPVPIALCI